MRIETGGGAAGHFRRLWRGEGPLWRVLFLDMLLRGTLLNLCAFGLTLTLIASDAPEWGVICAALLPLPYNLFLCTAVWRASAGKDDVLATASRVTAFAWVAAVMAV